MASAVIEDIEMLEKKTEEMERILRENPTEERKQKQIDARFRLGSDYVVMAEYDKAVEQFEAILKMIPEAEKRSIAEKGLNMVVVEALHDIHLQRKNDPNYKPKRDYEALAVAAGVYSPMPEIKEE